MRINTNVSALRAQRSTSEHTKQIESSSGKLSSGTRVRNAADDAASLSIGNKQKTNIRSQGQAIRNANDAVSLLQTAEGSMGEISNMLVRLRELSVQAASGHLQDSDRGMINNEYMALRREMERIARSSRFMGTDLLQDKLFKTNDFLIGVNNKEESHLKMSSEDFIVTEFTLHVVDSSIVNAEEAQINLKHIDHAIQMITEKRTKLGAFQNKLNSSISNLETSKVNETAAASRTMDADLAYETSEKMRSEGKLMAASSVLSQANQFSAMALNLLK